MTHAAADEPLFTHTLEAIGDVAKRVVQVPLKRLGYIESYDAPTNCAQVVLDGDSESICIQNATGLTLTEDLRVVIDFYPPHGVLITGVMSVI